MASREFFDPGLDLTGLGSDATNAQITQALRESTPADGLGLVIYQEGTPDLGTYTEYDTFIWIKPSTAETKFWNGSSWQLTRGLTVINDGDIGIAKLDVDGGDPLDLIRVNGAGTAFEFVAPADLFANGSFALAKLANAPDAGYGIVSGVGGVNEHVVLAELLKKAVDIIATALYDFNSYANDTLLVKSSADGFLYEMSPKTFSDAILANAPIAALNNQTYLYAIDGNRNQGSRIVRLNPNGLFMTEIGAAAAYNNPTTITVDAYGRVTDVQTTGVGLRTSEVVETTAALFPVGEGFANARAIPHGLGGSPRQWQLRTYCADAGLDAGWGPSDAPISFDSIIVQADPGSSDLECKYVVSADATNIYVMLPDADDVRVPHKTTGSLTAIDTTKWRILVSATR
jgi:hypothetical protein